jgi:hypothetical protein
MPQSVKSSPASAPFPNGVDGYLDQAFADTLEDLGVESRNRSSYMLDAASFELMGPPRPSDRQIIVEKGETLYSIAKREFGDGGLYTLLGDRALIHPGETLTVPGIVTDAMKDGARAQALARESKHSNAVVEKKQPAVERAAVSPVLSYDVPPLGGWDGFPSQPTNAWEELKSGAVSIFNNPEQLGPPGLAVKVAASPFLFVRMAREAVKDAGLLKRASADEARLVHMSERAEDILASGKLGLPSNNYAGPASNAGLTGWRLTGRTGLSPTTNYGAVPIPTHAESAFSKVVPVGPLTTWQSVMGHEYTARGVLDLATGSFARAGVNWNQVGIYSIDAAFTGSAVVGAAHLLDEKNK